MAHNRAKSQNFAPEATTKRTLLDRHVPQLSKNLRQLSRTRPGKNFYVFLVCVFIAAVFWCLKTFSKEYTTIVDVPVRYTQMPQQQVLLKELPTTIQVEIEAKGFGLLSQALRSSPDTLFIRADQLQERELASRRYSFLPTRNLLPSFTDQLRNDIRVTRILTDTIFFHFDKQVTRLLRVEPRFSRLEFAPQYLLDGEVALLPTAVHVTGPAAILDTLRIARTEPMDFANLTEKITQSTRLSIARQPGITCVPEEVLVTIPVDKFTETTIQVPITAQNVPEGLELRLFPTYIDVTLQVAYRHYQEITPSLFTATVDASQLDENAPTRLPVSVSSGPDFVHITRYDPLRVEYILKR